MAVAEAAQAQAVAVAQGTARSQHRIPLLVQS
jgi:hypothetical protein